MYQSPDSAMNELLARFHMIPPGSRVLCAVSGGADSIYLLHRLYLLRHAMGFELAAAHYNHNLRGAESDRDEAFVRERCAQWSLPFVSGRGDVGALAKREGLSVEEAHRVGAAGDGAEDMVPRREHGVFPCEGLGLVQHGQYS